VVQICFIGAGESCVLRLFAIDAEDFHFARLDGDGEPMPTPISSRPLQSTSGWRLFGGEQRMRQGYDASDERRTDEPVRLDKE